MTLKDAIRIVIVDESIEDLIYQIRDRIEDPAWLGNTWDHPRVIRYSEAVMRLKEELLDITHDTK